MTNDHQRQRLPNRRFRRLIPATVAAVTIAASAPFAASAHAHTHHTPHPPRAHSTPPPGKIAALTRADTTRGEQVERTSAT